MPYFKKLSLIVFLMLGAAFVFMPLIAQAVDSGDLIKIEGNPAVYYLGADGKRYVFPDEKIYFSWYADFSRVKVIIAKELATYPIGGNITYKPGVRLVKIQTDPKVYAVSEGGALRWVESEAIAVSLYGSEWAKLVNDIPEVFFTDYQVSSSIGEAAAYNKILEEKIATSPNKNMGLIAEEPSLSDNTGEVPVSDTPQNAVPSTPAVTESDTTCPQLGTPVLTSSNAEVKINQNVNFQWNIVAGTVSSYTLWRDSEPSFGTANKTLVKKTPSDTSATDNLSAAGAYYYQIQVNGCGGDTWSNTVKVVVGN